MDLKKVRELLDLMDANNLTEIVVGVTILETCVVREDRIRVEARQRTGDNCVQL